jgi:hypothetical protein
MGTNICAPARTLPLNIATPNINARIDRIFPP